MSLVGAVETPDIPVLGGSESLCDSAGFWLYANPIRVIRSDSGRNGAPLRRAAQRSYLQKTLRAYMRREYDMTRANEMQ